MKEDTIDFLKITDIDLATTLYCMGFPIDGIYDSERKSQFGDPIMVFWFLKDDRIDKAVLDYYSRVLRVDPYELFTTRKEIIQRMKDEARSRKLKENYRK